jgi:hypothetical protein
MDMGSISAALGGLKTAGEIAKALFELKSDAERQAKIIELQSVILAAQSSAIAAKSEQYSMLEEVRAAKEELAKAKSWDTEKLRYQLVSPNAGSMVYAVKRSMANGEPPHYLCANCFKQGKTSPVNDTVPPGSKDRWHAWYCPNCKSAPLNGYAGPADPKYAEELSV